jgi:WD40 repeat protein
MVALREWKTLPCQSVWDPVLSWGPDSRTLACGIVEGNIILWDVYLGRVVDVLPGNGDQLDVLAFSPDGTTLASAFDGYMDEQIKLWDIKAGRRWQTAGRHADHIYQLEFSPDGTMLASAAGEIKLWRVSSGHELRALQGLDTFDFSPDGATIAGKAVEDSVPERRRVIRIWDVITGAEIKTLRGQTEDIYHLTFNADGTAIASLGRDSHRERYTFTRDLITIWTVATGQEARVWHGGYDINEIAFHSAGNILATMGRYPSAGQTASIGLINLWDVESQQIVGSVTTSKALTAIAFSPDGSLLAGSTDQSIKVWKVVT